MIAEKKWVFLLLVVCLWALFPGAACAVEPLVIGLPGVDEAHYTLLIEDLAQALGPELPMRIGKTSWTDITTRKRVENPDTDLFLCPSDIHLKYLQSEDTEAVSNDIQEFRVVVPLFVEAVHAIVRADSPLRYFHEIARHKVFFGPPGSRGELTAETIYRLMFYREAPEKVQFPVVQARAQYLEALHALFEGRLDVVVMVGAPPIPLLGALDPAWAEKNFKFLDFDPTHTLSKRAARAYPAMTIPSGSLPWYLKETATLGVQNYLVTLNERDEVHRTRLSILTRALLGKLPSLQTKGRMKALWTSVPRVWGPFPEDWRAYDGTEDTPAAQTEHHK